MLDQFHKALGFGLANAAAQASAEMELIALERRWIAALIGRDVAALDRILADDFQLVWIDGSSVRKPEVLAGTAARKAEIEPFTTQGVEIRLYGQAAVVTGSATLKLKLGGQTEICHFRHTEVFAAGAAGWQAVSAQSALVCPPKSFFEPFDGAGVRTLRDAAPEEAPSRLVEQFFLLNGQK